MQQRQASNVSLQREPSPTGVSNPSQVPGAVSSPQDPSYNAEKQATDLALLLTQRAAVVPEVKEAFVRLLIHALERQKAYHEAFFSIRAAHDWQCFRARDSIEVRSKICPEASSICGSLERFLEALPLRERGQFIKTLSDEELHDRFKAFEVILC